MENIKLVASKLNLNEEDLFCYGNYKATIEIPKGINTKDYYLQMYFKHNGSSFSMGIEFVSFKGIY